MLVLGLGSGMGLGASLWMLSLWRQGTALQASFDRVTKSVAAEYDQAAWEREMDSLQADAEALRRRLGFLRALRGLPGVGREAQAVTALLASGTTDAAAARDVLQGVSLLRKLSQGSSVDSARAGQAYQAFLRAEGRLIPVEGPPPWLPPLRDRYDAVQQAEQQLRSLARWGRETASLLLALADLEKAVVRGEWSSSHLEDALQQVLAQVSIVQRDTQEVHQEFPPLAQDLERLSRMLDGLELAAEGATVGLEALRPALDLLEKEHPSLLHDGSAMARVLTILQEGREDLSEAAAKVEAGLGRLSQTSGVSLQRLEELPEAFQLLADIAPVASSLVGLEGSRKYLVLGQTADELRATGGFISTVWVITFRDGELTEVRYHDTVEVDDLNHLNLYPVPPEGLNRHMQACCWLLRDVSWEPDFPSTARLAQEIYELGQAERVDGVLALNQWTLQRLVEFLGGLPSPEDDRLISPEEFMSFLQEKTDEKGRGYASLLLPGLLEELERQASPSTLVALGRLVQNLFQEKLLLMYVNDQQVQALLHQLGWNGSVARGEGDYLMVVDSNVGWSKVDRNILRAVSYQVALQPHGASPARLSLEYRNVSGPKASGCQWQWMSRGKAYSEQMQACYWDYLRVYLSPGSTLVYADPMPLPPGSVYAQQGAGTVGEETLRLSSAYGKAALEGLILVPPGETVRQSFLYDLPREMVSHQGDRLGYTLTLQKQPGVLQRQVTVVITLPPGYRADEVTPRPQQMEEGRLVWQISLTQDVRIEVAFSP